MRSRHFTFALPLFVTALCVAQTPYQPTADDNQWVKSRVAFLTKVYELNPGQQAQLEKDCMSLMTAQADYQQGDSVRMTVRSLQVGMDQAMTGTTEDVRGAVIDRMNSQLYGIYTKAPLSYASIAAKLEPTLPKDQVDKGYGNMKVHFANQLRSGKTELKRENIDMLAGQSVELPSISSKKLALNIPPAATPMTVNSTPVAQAPARPPVPATPASPLPMTPPTVKPVMPPPPPPREYGPAPERDTWAARVDEVAAKYQFKPEQLARAKTILDQANKQADVVKEGKAMSEIYGVMNDRVNALASTEQRIKADGEKSVVPATPAQPAANAPIKIVPQAPPGAKVIDAGVAQPAKPADPPKPAEPAKPADASKP